MANFNNMQPVSGYDDYGMEDIDMEMDKFFGPIKKWALPKNYSVKNWQKERFTE